MTAPKLHVCVKELVKVIKVHIYFFSEEGDEVVRRT